MYTTFIQNSSKYLRYASISQIIPSMNRVMFLVSPLMAGVLRADLVTLQQ